MSSYGDFERYLSRYIKPTPWKSPWPGDGAPSAAQQFKPEFVVGVTQFALELIDSIADIFNLNEMFTEGVATEMRYS